MLIAQNITKFYGSKKVLDNVNLTVQSAEIVSIVGASGAGKSTLLQILGTLDKADTGDVLMNDIEIKRLSEKQLAAFRNQTIGFVFQFHNLLPEFSAIENVCLPAWIANKKSKSEIEKDALHLLKTLGLADKSNQLPSQMSGGEQQRTAVARALINNPIVVFADEPSGNLDTKNAQELHNLFFELRDKLGQSFVIVTHNEELARRADRRIELVDGKILEGN